MREEMERLVVESGLWEGERRKSHSFLLSPDAYTITEAQVQQLKTLGLSLRDTLLGLSMMGVLSGDDNLVNGKKTAWTMLRRAFQAGVPSTYHQFQYANPMHVPLLLKVDLMLDINGQFKIAEIDGHNKHGVGYSAVARDLRELSKPKEITLPGAIPLLAESIRKQDFEEVTLLYASYELFYKPEFQIVADKIADYGILCRPLSELDASDNAVSQGLFFDFPPLYKRPDITKTISYAYNSGNASFLIPPKPFLGGKACMAILRNDMGDPELEGILNSFIPEDSLFIVRSHLPRTFLVGKHGINKSQLEEELSSGRFVLKESISSGMKGTVFSDDPSFPELLLKAQSTRANWILQQEVANMPQLFSWFDPATKDLHSANDWFIRVTVHYVDFELAEITVTARRDKAVHGAKDSLQLGTIIV